MLTRLFAVFIFIFSLVYCINILASESQEIKIAYLAQEQQVPAALSNLAPFIADKGLQGALLGLRDNNTTGQFTQQNYLLEQVIVPIGGDVKQAFSQILKQGIQLVIVNLPAQQLPTTRNQRFQRFFNIYCARASARMARLGKICRTSFKHWFSLKASVRVATSNNNA
jgi:hypothetical protein